MRGKRMALAMMLAGIGFAAAAEPVQAGYPQWLVQNGSLTAAKGRAEETAATE